MRSRSRCATVRLSSELAGCVIAPPRGCVRSRVGTLNTAISGGRVYLVISASLGDGIEDPRIRFPDVLCGRPSRHFLRLARTIVVAVGQDASKHSTVHVF
jgi:hypothetical protein